MNLVANAIQALPQGGNLSVTTGLVDRGPPVDVGGPVRRWHFIRVEDDGAGIAPEHRARVFDPFFSTKGVGEGTGLGLSISYAIAREHDGWLSLEAREPRGCRFTLFIPGAA